MTTLLRWLAVAVLIVLVGFLGLWAMFTDQGPQESLLGRGLLVTIVYLLAGATVGVLVPKRWYVAALSAWGPALLGLFALLSIVVRRRERVAVGPMPSVGFLVLSLLVVPAVALASGLLGKAVVVRREAGARGSQRRPRGRDRKARP